MLPTFLGIGAQRAGTTWAYECLAEHPQVFMAEKKELHYFYVNYRNGQQWYEGQFAAAGQALARGEITPDYLYHECALKNIARDLPDVRLFVILRNPIDRALSQYVLHQHRFGGRPFNQVSGESSELIDRGLYHKHLSKAFEYFDRGRIHIMFYDDLVERPDLFVSQLYKFVGVDQSYRPESLRKRYNRILYPKLQRILMSARLGWVIDEIKRTPLGEWIRGINSSQDRNLPLDLSENELQRLRTYFVDDVTRLSKLVERDLSCWLRS